MTIDLVKSERAFKISLEKKGVQKMPELEMALVMDVSYSFDDEHKSGVTNDLTVRITPWGLTFDPDRKIDMFTFSNGEESAHLVGSITEENYADFIPRYVIEKVPGYNGGTHYSHVVKAVLAHFGWLPKIIQTPAKTGFLGGLFGGKKQNTTTIFEEKRRAVVFMVSDGDNNDEAAINSVMASSDQANHEVFFIFVGVSNQNVSFRTLRGFDAKYSNSSFVEIKDIKSFVEKTDEEINEFFLTPKLVSWLKK